MGTQHRQLKIKPRAGYLRAVENRQSQLRVPVPVAARFLRQLNRELGLLHGAAFVCFVADREMKRLNGQFRKKPETTDVLSFPSKVRTRPRSLASRIAQVRGEFLGDIAISPTVARRNAKGFRRTLSEEICILMLHGVLHLLGYDHDTDRGEMERVEAALRSRLGLN
jgi:probable rRNA maturation factor